MNKDVIKILQGSVVTQTVLGGLISYSAHVPKYENGSVLDKSYMQQ